MTVTLSTELASTLDRVQWSLDSCNDETRKVKGDVMYLEAKVETDAKNEAGFRNGAAKLKAAFKNEVYERTKGQKRSLRETE